ncbi:MAG: SH3 domain-containing protein [Magnetococcales bacterium]|nr:SH3 domain-containing protein [Magnetococcales bacterium]
MIVYYIIFIFMLHTPLLGSSDAFATADGPDYWRVTISSGTLNIRSKPHFKGARIGSIPTGETELRNLGCTREMTFSQYQSATPSERINAKYQRWCKVNYQGTIGWVAGWFLAE